MRIPRTKSTHSLTSTRAREKKKSLALVKSTPKASTPKPAPPEEVEVRITRDEVTGELTIPQAVWQKIRAGFGNSRAGYCVFLTLMAKAIALSPNPSSADLMDPNINNFCIDVAATIAPDDPVEVMLVNQMIGTHWNAMMLLSTKPRDAARLLRVFTAQVEALRNYRRKGVQTIVYKHQAVNVNAGGQAVVGNLVTGGAKNER